MPSCCYRKCSNNSRNTNKDKGVTFHAFPQESKLKQEWIKIVQEDQRDELWLPTQYTRVCSEHFRPKDFYFTKLGRRKLHENTIPLLQKDQLSPISNVNINVENPLENEQGDEMSHVTRETDGQTRKKQSIDQVICKKGACRKEILKLKRQNKYLKRNNAKLKQLLKTFSSKFYNKRKII